MCVCVCVCVYICQLLFIGPPSSLPRLCVQFTSFSHLHCILPINLPTFLSYMVQGQITSSTQSRPLYNH